MGRKFFQGQSLITDAQWQRLRLIDDAFIRRIITQVIAKRTTVKNIWAYVIQSFDNLPGRNDGQNIQTKDREAEMLNIARQIIVDDDVLPEGM